MIVVLMHIILSGTGTTYTTGIFGNGLDFEALIVNIYLIADANCANLEITW